MFLYALVLFFVLTPAIFVRIPPSGNKYLVAFVHALIFAIIWELTHKFVWNLTNGMPTMMMPMSTPTMKMMPMMPTLSANVMVPPGNTF